MAASPWQPPTAPSKARPKAERGIASLFVSVVVGLAVACALGLTTLTVEIQRHARASAVADVVALAAAGFDDDTARALAGRNSAALVQLHRTGRVVTVRVSRASAQGEASARR